MNSKLTAAIAALLVVTTRLAAQAPEPAGRSAHAAESITAGDVAHRVGIIAHDSMLGRDTPSRGLELTAQYVADQFRQFGLKPGGEDGTWFQRYPITRRRLELAKSNVMLEVGGVSVTAPFDRAARYVSGDIPGKSVSGPAVLVGGKMTPEAVSGMNLQDKVVLYVHDYSKRVPLNAAQVARAIRLSRPRAIVAISNLDSAEFAARVPRSAPERFGMELRLNSPPSVEVSEAVHRAGPAGGEGEPRGDPPLEQPGRAAGAGARRHRHDEGDGARFAQRPEHDRHPGRQRSEAERRVPRLLRPHGSRRDYARDG